MHVDLTDLRLVVLIAEEGSLTRAAERAHLSLSAVSLRVKTLEDRLGSRIVYREASGARLSTAGEVLVVHARKVLQQMDALQAELSQYSRELRGQMRIFANTTAVTDFLPEITRRFLTLNPHVNVDIHERMNGDIARAVMDGAADFGVVAGAVAVTGLEAIHFATDRLVLAVARSHPLAGEDSVRFAATLPYDHVLLREGSTLQAFLAGIAQSNGHTLNVRTQVQSFESLARMVEANVGIGVLPESAARRHAQTMDIALVAIDEEWAVRQRFVVVRDRAALPGYTQQFIALICATGSASDAALDPAAAFADAAAGEAVRTSAASRAGARRRS